jgi:hypothetical protein
MKARGITLAELLISASLFLLALLVCGELALVGVRSRNQTMDRNSEIRQWVTAFQSFQRELRLARVLYSPDLSDLSEKRPGIDSPALVVATSDASGLPKVSGWKMDGQQLMHFLYRNDYDPARPATQQLLTGSSPQRIPGVVALKVRRLPPGDHYGGRLLRLELEPVPPHNQRLATVVETRY